MEPTPTIHIVDDNAAVRDSLRFILEAEHLAVRTYEDAASFLQAKPADTGCVLTDFRMPGIDGLELQRELVARGGSLPIILMTGAGDIPFAVAAMKAGALDVLEKPFEPAVMLKAVQHALEANRRMREKAMAAHEASSRIAALTPREREVLDLLVASRSNKEIGQELGASPRTIEVHRAHIFQKLRIMRISELVELVRVAGSHIQR